MIHDSISFGGVSHRRKTPNLFPSVVLADRRQPSNAVVNEIFMIGGGKIWSLLVDAIEAADEGIGRKGDLRGVDGERIVLERM